MLRHTATAEPKPQRGPPKRRGSYNCGRCGQPKKGHVCHLVDPVSSCSSADPTATPPPPPRSDHRLRRALSFDGADEGADSSIHGGPREGEEEDEEVKVGCGPLTASCLVQILRRLSPRELMGVAAVSKGWRDLVKRVWISAEEVKLRVNPRSQIGFVGSVLNKCVGLTRLTLTMESDADATVLACVAFSCPNLEVFDMKIASIAANRITGDELGRFVSEKKSLSVLKVEGCTNLGFLSICSSTLSTLWLSDLYCISKTVINCPNLKEISLDFTRQDNDSTDLVTVVDCVGRNCQRLRNIHISSVRLCNDAVLTLAQANLRALRMLSLVLGSKITDSSIAAIVRCYTSLELLDLSGSSISDSGIGMICNELPKTLSRLFLALCPNITSSGIQFATAQLPLLQLFDCGMSICDPSSENESVEGNELQNNQLKKCQKVQNLKPQPIYQKLFIKHGCLRKLSLWGCSGLDGLYLSCPELNDLNLNSCTNLITEKLDIKCPNLKNIHASGCQDMLIKAIQNKVLNEFPMGNNFPCKRLADGSKRVLVPYFLSQQPPDDEKRKRVRLTKCSLHLDR